MNVDEEMEDAEMGEDDEESAEVNELGDRVSNLFGLEDDGEEESGKDEYPGRLLRLNYSMVRQGSNSIF